MATFSISGNVSTATAAIANEVVYIQEVQTAYPQPAPATAQTDASGNYSFSGLSAGTYQVKTAGAPLARQIVTIVANNVTGVNFSA
jgi:hypothetical protein